MRIPIPSPYSAPCRPPRHQERQLRLLDLGLMGGEEA